MSLVWTVSYERGTLVPLYNTLEDPQQGSVETVRKDTGRGPACTRETSQDHTLVPAVVVKRQKRENK